MIVIIGPDGLGREENPYPKYTNSSYEVSPDLNGYWCDFEKQHPPLPVISPTGEAVTEPGSYEVEMVWQYSRDGKWDIVNECKLEFKKQMGYETRQTYRILPQQKEAVKEEKLSVIQMAKKLGIKGISDFNIDSVISEATKLGYKYGDLGFEKIYGPGADNYGRDKKVVDVVATKADILKKYCAVFQHLYIPTRQDLTFWSDGFEAGRKSQSTHIEKSKVVELVERRIAGYRQEIEECIVTKKGEENNRMRITMLTNLLTELQNL